MYVLTHLHDITWCMYTHFIVIILCIILYDIANMLIFLENGHQMPFLACVIYEDSSKGIIISVL